MADSIIVVFRRFLLYCILLYRRNFGMRSMKVDAI